MPQEADCFSQEPGGTLSVISETKALTCALLTRLITIYLKLKFSNSWVPFDRGCLPTGPALAVIRLKQLRKSAAEAGCSQEEGPKKGFVMGSRTQSVQEILEKYI